MEEGRQHLETQQCYFLSNSAFHPQRNDFLLVSIRHNPIQSISAVLLSLEPSRGDGWLVIIVTIVASSFAFRHFRISIAFC